MDKVSSLGFSFDRVLIQLIIPGLFAISPYLFLIFYKLPFQKIIFDGSLAIIFSITLIISMAVGMLIENIGSIIEVKVYDKKNEKLLPDYYITWNKYLVLNYNGKEPIGHRYIRSVLLRMKFELSFGIALIPCFFGVILLDYYFVLIGSIYLKFIFFVFCPCVLMIYLLKYEAYSSSLVLAKTRKLLVEEYSLN